MKPLIGVTGRLLTLGMLQNTSPLYRDRQISTYFADFAAGVAGAGGIPVELPWCVDAAEVVERLDGLVVTGGQDVHPSRWGGQAVVDASVDPRWSHDAHDLGRDAYEAALIEAAIDRGIPVLGICRGHQLLNVVRGGTLIEHLEDGGPITHSSRNPAPSTGDDEHLVEFVEGSVVHAIYGPRRRTNSWHHQAVDRPGRGITVTGRTADGVVESIALDGRPVIGVQWHPEWSGEPDPAFDWLVEQSTQIAAGRARLAPQNV